MSTYLIWVGAETRISRQRPFAGVIGLLVLLEHHGK